MAETVPQTTHRTAWLAGATGLVGSFVLRQLLASEWYSQVVALTRRTMNVDHPKLEQRLVDFDQLQSIDLPPAEDVFCALGTTIKKAGSQEAFRRVDLDYPRVLANKAAASGAQQFLFVSSAGANTRSRNFYLRTKGELEDAISALPFKSIHVFRPSLLVGPRRETRVGERVGTVLMKLLAPFLVGGLRKYRSINAEEVAQAMAAAAVLGGPGKKVYEYEQLKALAKQG
jgi:uncharacterized protein YbjT (DUF2867 family)